MTTAAVRICPLASLSENVGVQRRILGALYEACFGEPRGAAAVAILLAAPGSLALVARRDANGVVQDVGFIIFRHVVDEAEILSLGVVSAARRQGIGRSLLAAAAAHLVSAGAADVFLEVGEDNEAARRMYETAGFVPVGRRPDYYRQADRGGVAAVVMRKSNRRT